MRLPKQKGFTMLELLLAIAIAGIIATIGISTFPGILERSRDGRRKSDLKIIASALEQYYSDQNYYPSNVTASSINVTSNSGSSPWITDLSTAYIKNLPLDPKNGASFYYSYTVPLTHQSYVMWANLERNDDPDRRESPTASCTLAASAPYTNKDFCVQSP